jgi:hypothetical protein
MREKEDYLIKSMLRFTFPKETKGKEKEKEKERRMKCHYCVAL